MTPLLPSDHGKPGSRVPFHLKASRNHWPLELRYGTMISKSGVASTFPTVSVPNCQSPSPAWNEESSPACKLEHRNTDMKTMPNLPAQRNDTPLCMDANNRGNIIHLPSARRDFLQ